MPCGIALIQACAICMLDSCGQGLACSCRCLPELGADPTNHPTVDWGSVRESMRSSSSKSSGLGCGITRARRQTAAPRCFQVFVATSCTRRTAPRCPARLWSPCRWPALPVAEMRQLRSSSCPLCRFCWDPCLGAREMCSGWFTRCLGPLKGVVSSGCERFSTEQLERFGLSVRLHPRSRPPDLRWSQHEQEKPLVSPLLGDERRP